MAKKSYKWLFRLIDKITKKDFPLNNYFTYYGHDVNLMSGTRGYVSCDVSDIDVCNRYNNIISFNFDFWAKKLVFESYTDYDVRNVVASAFFSFYMGNDVTVVDEVIDGQVKFYNNAEVRENLGDDYCNIQIEKLEHEKINC